jgi:hypothetical protein
LGPLNRLQILTNRFTRIDSHGVFLIVLRRPSMLNFAVGTSMSITMLCNRLLESLSTVITMKVPWYISMDRTCSSLDMSRKGAFPDFCRSRRYLSYAETKKDHSVTDFLNTYSVPYVCSSLLLNIGAFTRRKQYPLQSAKQ